MSYWIKNESIPTFGTKCVIIAFQTSSHRDSATSTKAIHTVNVETCGASASCIDESEVGCAGVAGGAVTALAVVDVC